MADSAFDKARELSLQATGDRLKKVENRQAQRRRINNLVKVTGFDSKLGKHFGTRPDGSVMYFALATNGAAPIGKEIEVAMPRGSTLGGRGDLKPRQ